MDLGQHADFIAFHREMIDLYQTAVTAEEGERAGLLAKMEALRERIRPAGCAASLVAFERYLDLLCLRFGDPSLKDRLTLLDAESLERTLRRDPSRPAVLIGAALAWRRQGRPDRARQLLRRLAASRYPEHRTARQLLAQGVAETGSA